MVLPVVRQEWNGFLVLAVYERLGKIVRLKTERDSNGLV